VKEKKMKQQDFSALDPLGKALLAYWRGTESTQIIQEYRSGRKKSIPASVFFRNIENFYPTEDVFSYCQGRILVVGAGTGVHVLELEQQGYEVTAVEVNPQAVQIMKERGVKDIRHCDFFEFSGQIYETILMLGHNIGICETIDRIKILLQRCKSLLVPDGQLLVNSVDESVSSNVKRHNGYPGEQEFRLSYAGNLGPWMRWLHVDFETLSMKASECGWSIEQLVETKNGEFLAKLNP
jgi:2-polyprenyl-3-methyl-5-hydroxy-6-metoxy-1,4-benzoquinol methylase